MVMLPPPAAVVFDMDGVLIDSERAWRVAEDAYLESIAPGYSRAEHHGEVIGIRLKDLYRLMCRRFGATLSFQAFQQHYHEVGQDIYGRRVALLPGVEAALDHLDRHQIPIGLASSSPHAWIDASLDRFRLRSYFSAIVSGDDVPHGKPAPDIYLKATQQLGQVPERCWAVEDAGVGVLAAKAAGLVAIGFRNGHNDEQPLEAADHIIHDLASLGNLIR